MKPLSNGLEISNSETRIIQGKQVQRPFIGLTALASPLIYPSVFIH